MNYHVATELKEIQNVLKARNSTVQIVIELTSI